MGEYYGHMTYKDGSHTSLTEDEAAAIWKHFEERCEKLAADMPEPWDATGQIIRAKERLRALGWREGGGLSVHKGDKCAVIELGSAGMWSGWLDEKGEYVHYAGCVSARRKVWLKPLTDLTEAEAIRMRDGDADAVESIEQELRMFSVLDEVAQGESSE